MKARHVKRRSAEFRKQLPECMRSERVNEVTFNQLFNVYRRCREYDQLSLAFNSQFSVMSLPTLRRFTPAGARAIISRPLVIQARWNSAQNTPPLQQAQISGSARTEQKAMTSIADIVGQPFGNTAMNRPAVPEYSTSLTDTSFLQTPTRPGYTVDNLPPKVDPTLELFAHLIMKHGRKAEAHKVVADVLQQLQVYSSVELRA